MKEITRKFKSEMGISGEVEIKKRDIRTGEIVEERKGNNMLLDSYLNNYFEEGTPLIHEDVFDICRLGDDDTPADRSQTGLQGNELASKSIQNFLSEGIEKADWGASKLAEFDVEKGSDYYERGMDIHPNDNLLLMVYSEVASIFDFNLEENTLNELITIEAGSNKFTNRGGVFHHNPEKNIIVLSDAGDNCQVWEYDLDAETATKIATYDEHTDSISHMEFETSKENVVVSSEEGQIHFWSYDETDGTTSKIMEYTGHTWNKVISEFDLHPNPDISIVVSGDNDYKVKLWEYDLDGETTNTLTSVSFDHYVNSVSLHPSYEEKYIFAVGIREDTTHKVYEYDLDTEELTETVDSPYLRTPPSVDVNQVYFKQCEEGNINEADLCVMSSSYRPYVGRYYTDERYFTLMSTLGNLSDGEFNEVRFFNDLNKDIIFCREYARIEVFQLEPDPLDTIEASGEWVFEAGEGTGTIREVHLQSDLYNNAYPNNHVQVARKVIDPAIEKDKYHELIVKWTIKATKPGISVNSGTITGAGMNDEDITFDLTMGNSNLAHLVGERNHLLYRIHQDETDKVRLQTSEEYQKDFLSGTFVDGYIMSDILETNETYQISKTYTPEDYKMNFRLTLDVDDSLTDEGIATLRIEQPEEDGEYYGFERSYFRTSFDPKLEKTDTYRIHFDYEFQLNPS